MIKVRKLQKPLALFLLCCTVLLVFSLAGQAAGESSKLVTYIVYDSKTRFGEPFPVVDALQEYLGHFELEQKLLQVDAWQQGALQDAGLVIFVGLKDEELSSDFLQELAAAPKVVWFEKNIGQLAEQLNWQDFHYDGMQSGWTTIDVGEQEYYISGWLDFAVSQAGAQAKTWAQLKNLSQTEAFAWQRDNIYYCSRLELAEQPFNVLMADALHALIPSSYDKNYSFTKSVLLRIEGVTPLSQPADLKSIIAEADKYGIAYAVSVMPVEVNDGQKVYLSDKQDIVEILQAAQENGASIVMNGFMNENEFSHPEKGSYEFWNIAEDKPLEHDEQFVRERLESGLLELAQNNLYPVAFQVPHYVMSKKDYAVLSKYFNILSGQIHLSDKSSDLLLALPYITKSVQADGMILVPENLGYYDGTEHLVESILQNAKNLGLAQDCFAGFSYHNYMPPDKLGEIIDGIEKQGFTFFDLRSLPVRAGSDDVKIVVDANRNLSAEINQDAISAWKEKVKKSKGYVIGDWGVIHITVLVLVILAFIFIIISLQKNANKKYEE